MNLKTVSALEELFDRYIGVAMARQCAFADSVPEPYWNWEYVEEDDTGIVKIPNFGEFEVQFIGSESYVSNTWLAGWANQSVAPGFAHASEWLRDNAEKLGDKRLGDEYLPLDHINGDYVGVIATTLLQASAYIALPVGNGAGMSFQVLFDIPLVNFAPTPMKRINTVLSMIEQSEQVTSVSTAAYYYLEDEGFKCEERTTADGIEKQFIDDLNRQITFVYKEIEENGEKLYEVTRNMPVLEEDFEVSPDHFDVRAQWDAFIRAPLSRVVIEPD